MTVIHSTDLRQRRVYVPTLRDRLRMTREEAYLEQDEMAKIMRVSRVTVSNWERGFTRPKHNDLVVWALTTDFDATWLETGSTSAGYTTRDSNPEPVD
ncbi:MAG: helix-turn-helix domain-containing protein [Propionibacteriaceae bacterium]|nr:helix-turn-helix domain-containing protein [Propionibacteriaceae bacterium]